MTQQERSEQIALMLGWIKKGNLYAPSENDFFIEELTFHSDWSYLMDAVEFIEKIYSYRVKIESRSCIIYKNSDIIIQLYSIKSKQEAVFIAVSNFAKKYNNKEL
jgi:hypothetical protein